MASLSSSSNYPCAACKFLRRKCIQNCVFAPYFPPEEPHKFANVHRIFGASNVTKLLHDIPIHQREDAVLSLAYEAEARIKDPVFGSYGTILILQKQVHMLQEELDYAKANFICSTCSENGVGLLPSSIMSRSLSSSMDELNRMISDFDYQQGESSFSSQFSAEFSPLPYDFPLPWLDNEESDGILRGGRDGEERNL